MRDLDPSTLSLLRDGIEDRALVDPRPSRVRTAAAEVAREVDRCGGGFSDYLELLTRRTNSLGNQLSMAGSTGRRMSFSEVRDVLETLWRARHHPYPRSA